VLAEIKADPDLQGIPVAVLTSSTESDDVAEAYGLGATCFITKPVRYAEFVDAVRELGRFWFTTVTPGSASSPSSIGIARSSRTTSGCRAGPLDRRRPVGRLPGDGEPAVQAQDRAR
jgi:DNA-binding response OmpR family regulator